MTSLESSSGHRVRFGGLLRPAIPARVVRITAIALVLPLALVAGGCSSHQPSVPLATAVVSVPQATIFLGTPEAAVDGALRSTTRAFVAPPEYRSGLLAQPLADAWIARAQSDYRQWYASPKLDDMISALHNVIGGMAAQPAPILAFVDGMTVHVPSAIVSGDEAKVDEATVSYVKHYVPGSWDQPDVPYSAMCNYTLHHTPDGWRVTEASCTDSGG